MAILKVIRMGHPTLKKVADQLTKDEILSDTTKSLIQDMYDTMKFEGGVGIAAPQVNISKQIALIEVPESSGRYGELEASPLMIIINPKISFLTEETQSFYEGCLSVPGLRGLVERPKKIKIEYFDENAIEQEIIAENFLATVFQHELDHLFGKLYVERISDLSTLTFVEEFEQFNKKEHSEIE